MGANKEMCKKSKEGEGSPMKRRYLPLELRIKLYEEAHKLRKMGFKYKEIIEKIYEEYGVKLCVANISFWTREKHHPLGKLNRFNAEPTPELCYVIGTVFGDGSKDYYYNNVTSHYQLELTVKDKEFAETFGKNLAKVLGREKSYKLYYSPSKKCWRAVGRSKLLFNFLNQPLENLKQYIEFNKECVTSFLRALFDSEGSIYKRALTLYNTDKELLEYAGYLLKKYFNIDTSLYLTEKAGKIHRFPNGRIYKTTKNEYELYIRAKSLMNFYKYIRFSIGRKQRSLEKVIENQK